MLKKFYITTTAPYVNADPHIGFALEIIQADVIARFKRLQGYEVAFGFGTDEHGLKIYQKALEQKKNPLAYCDEYAKKFVDLKKMLNLSVNYFMRTTNPAHIQAAQEFWSRCFQKGDIYKKNYKTKYCVGCELEKTDSELVENKCPIHPKLNIEIIEEENYFFRFSKYQEKLLRLYREQTDFVLPSYRLKEIQDFVQKGLEDFSVSRLKKKMPWGIDVPGDADHVMYVWFDALIYYISTLGWPKDEKNFNDFWPVVQVAGKDNLRQQSAIWQAMLMSAGLPNSKQIFIHGFITSNGQKMSKSLGNVVNPFELIKKYGVDAVRYYLLREIPPTDDGDYSENRMKELYNSDLANELGNLISRVTNLCEQNNIEFNSLTKEISFNSDQGGFAIHLEKFEFNLALEELWKDIKKINYEINLDRSWSMEGPADFLKHYLKEIQKIAYALQPFLPETSEKILKATQGKIKKILPLFPRL
jgi:methionyl-tRNA synthetase